MTTTFSLKQGETRTCSGPIPHPLKQLLIMFLYNMPKRNIVPIYCQIRKRNNRLLTRRGYPLIGLLRFYDLPSYIYTWPQHHPTSVAPPHIPHAHPTTSIHIPYIYTHPHTYNPPPPPPPPYIYPTILPYCGTKMCSGSGCCTGTNQHSFVERKAVHCSLCKYCMRWRPH